MPFLVGQAEVVLVDVVFRLALDNQPNAEKTRRAARACVPLKTARPTSTLTETETKGCT